MADYAKKKNDELAALCKERGLAHTGKKADLVKRLEEYDASSSAAPAVAAAPEDEIDWDEEPAVDAGKATAPAAAAETAAAPQTSEPQTESIQTDSIEPAPTATAAEPAKPEVDFSTGLAARTLDEEIEKRKARARKFGLPEDSEEIKALERAKRFGGNEIPGLGLLNGALPEKRERAERKRNGNASESDGGVRKPGKGRGPRGKGEGGGNDKPKTKSGDGGYPGWMTQKDREAADRRKARFSSAT